MTDKQTNLLEIMKNLGVDVREANSHVTKLSEKELDTLITRFEVVESYCDSQTELVSFSK